MKNAIVIFIILSLTVDCFSQKENFPLDTVIYTKGHKVIKGCLNINIYDSMSFS